MLNLDKLVKEYEKNPELILENVVPNIPKEEIEISALNTDNDICTEIKTLYNRIKLIHCSKQIGISALLDIHLNDFNKQNANLCEVLALKFSDKDLINNLNMIAAKCNVEYSNISTAKLCKKLFTSVISKCNSNVLINIAEKTVDLNTRNITLKLLLNKFPQDIKYTILFENLFNPDEKIRSLCKDIIDNKSRDELYFNYILEYINHVFDNYTKGRVDSDVENAKTYVQNANIYIKKLIKEIPGQNLYLKFLFENLNHKELNKEIKELILRVPSEKIKLSVLIEYYTIDCVIEIIGKIDINSIDLKIIFDNVNESNFDFLKDLSLRISSDSLDSKLIISYQDSSNKKQKELADILYKCLPKSEKNSHISEALCNIID